MEGWWRMPRRSGTRPSPALRARSAELRREQTPTEQILWQHVRGGKTGTKFRRFIEREAAHLDTLIAKAQEMIAVLRKHRTALVAAAVTGQIDVRGERS